MTTPRPGSTIDRAVRAPKSGQPHNDPGLACELLKLLRGTWMDRAQLADELGVSRNRCDRWVAEFERQGLLVQRDGPKPAKGYAATEFTVAAEWVGVAR